jgi:hypothetical protein
VVEAARLAVEHVGVYPLAPEPADEVDVARLGQQAEGVLLGVGVEVAEHEEVGVAARGGIAGQPLGERPGRRSPRRAAIPLAVARVGVAGRVAGRALRLPVVHDHREDLSGRTPGEGLCEARAVARVVEAGVGARVEDGRGPRGREGGGPVEERHRDRLAAERPTGVHDRVGSERRAARERLGQVADGAPRSGALVLELREPQQVRLEPRQQRGQLRALEGELLGRPGAARRREATAPSVPVEVATGVEKGDAQAPAARGGRGLGPRLRSREAHRARRVDAVAAEGEAHDAFEPREPIAEAERAIAREVGDGTRVAGAASVVEEHAPARVRRGPGGRLGPRGHPVGRSREAPSRRQLELAEAAEVEVVGRDQRLRDAHAHPLDALPVLGAADRERERRRRGERFGPARHGRAERHELRLAEELGDLAPHPQARAWREVELGLGIEDEEALGGRGVRVRVAVLLLEEKAAETGREARELAHDDRLDDELEPAQGTRAPRALDRVEGDGGCAAGTSACVRRLGGGRARDDQERARERERVARVEQGKTSSGPGRAPACAAAAEEK